MIHERARGEAARFVSKATAYGAAPEVTRIRIHLDTIEKVLTGRRKVIVDSTAGGVRRRVLFGPPSIWNSTPPASPADRTYMAEPQLD